MDDRGQAEMNGSLAGSAPVADVPAGYKRTEAGVIPQDWGVSSVGAEFTVQLGKMLDAAKNVGTPKPYIGNRAVQWRQIVLDDMVTVPMIPSEVRRFRLRRGDLLVCEGGEIGRAAIWNDLIPECFHQKALHRLRPTGSYVVYLMLSLLQLWASTGCLANYVTQTSIAHLPKEKLELIPLPVPPPDEQLAIAEALSDVDDLLFSLENLIVKKQAIKQATMQQLLTGKIRLPGFSGEWETKQLGRLGSFLKGRGIKREDVSSTGYSCIRYGELYTRYENYILNAVARIPSSIAQTALPVKTGDLLFAGSGETSEEIGRCAAYLGDEPAYAGGDVVVLTPLGQNSLYLGYMMNQPTVARQKARMGQGDAVVHINTRNLAQIQIDLPPIEEQTEIAAILFDMDAEIATLERRRDKTRALKQGMMQQLLTGRIRLLMTE